MNLFKNAICALMVSGATVVSAMDLESERRPVESVAILEAAEDKRIIDMHRKTLSVRIVRSLKQDESIPEGSGSEPVYIETGESCVMVTSRNIGPIAILEKQESLQSYLKTRMQQDTQVHYIYGDAVKDEIERIVKGYNDTINNVVLAMLSQKSILTKQADGRIVTEKVAGIGEYADGSLNTSGVIQYVCIPDKGLFAILPI